MRERLILHVAGPAGAGKTTFIERAQLVVVNVRSEEERPAADALVADVARLRKDEAVFRDVIGWRGHKLPVTAVCADLSNPKDAGVKRRWRG